MTGLITKPEDIKPHSRYWLNKSGTAWLVSDHLQAAQYAKAESDEFDNRGPWSYEDMWRNGWVRVHSEINRIWADGQDGVDFTRSQKIWLRDSVIYLSKKTGIDVRLARGKDATERILEANNPTAEFRNAMSKISPLAESLLDGDNDSSS